MSYIDTGRKEGVAMPREQLPGLKSERPESVLSFARRHGWEGKEETDSDSGLTDVRLRKGDNLVDLVLAQGTRTVLSARTGQTNEAGEYAYLSIPHPYRERVEKFLVGARCVCAPQADLFHWEKTPNPECEIHGDA